MKDFFNARQRFSIRKFSFGAASVLLGTVFLAQAPVAHADGTTETENTSSSTASDEDSSATSATAPTVPSTPDTTSSTGTVTVTETEASSATADTTSETPAEKTTETASTATDKSKLASQIAALEAAINKAPAGTDAAALTQAKVALAQAKSIQASTSASQAEVDAQAASLADMVTVVAEAANQAEQAETESKETAAEAAQPAEKTELEKTVSEATVTNKLATDFVEKEAPAKEVAVDLTDAVKSAVADNQAQITAAQAVLADEKATTDAYQTAMAQLKSSIEAVYVSLRKAGKEDFAVALAETTGSTDSETSEKDALTKKVNLLDTVLKNTDITKNLDSQLLTDSSTALSEAQTVLSNDSATTTELESAIKQVGGYLQAIFKEIPLTATSSDSINAAAIGTGVGVLVDTTETVTPDMNDANGAVVKKAPPMIVHGNTLQPTSVENQYTFAYMPPLYLEYTGVAPEEAKTLYIRGSRSLDVSNTDVLVEIVKQADNTVLETHTLKAGENYKSTAMTANGYGVYIGYDTTASGAQSIGKIVAYMMSYPSSWSLGSFEIPREADYTTKYMTVDGKELATYTLKAWSDQITDPSGVREFTNYKYVDSVVNSDPELNVDEIDSVSRLATMYGAKVLRRVVKPDGTVVKSFWIKDPTLNNDSTKIAPDEGSDTTGYIKLFETDEISPWSTNTNLNFFYGDATKMSNGEILMTQENAEKIKALAAQVKETNPIFNGASDNTVRIYINPEDEGKPESNDIRSIEIGFVGNFESVIPYGVVTPGKSLYVRNRTLGSGKPNNFQLVPLYNNLLFVPEVTHIYEPKVASVVVNYVDDAGNVLTGTGTFTNDASKTLAIPEKNSDGYQVLDQAEVPTKDKTAYNTADNRPDKITTADGKIYYLQGVSSTTTDATEGTLDTEGQRVITYVYQQAGSVDVTYVNEKGNTISGKATGISKDTVASTEVDVDADGNPVTNVKPGTEYDTTDLRPKTITVTNADGTETVYYYKELNTEKSHYDNGTPDGENPNDDVFDVTEKGQVRPGTTHVVYTYEQAGSVVVHYETTDGTKLDGELTFDDATTTTNVPTTGLADETDAEPGKAYDTKDHKPVKITANGTVYYLVSKAVDGKYSADGVKEGSDAETGEVEAGKTKEVTYVYEKAGNVNINYITTDGTVIKTPVKDVENGKPGDAYNAAETATDNTGEKPARITTADGKVYQLVTTAGTTTGGDTKLTYDANGVVTATADGGNTINNNPIGGQTGQVAAGQTTEVTYVYQEVKGNVVVKYKTTDGTQLSGDLTLDGTDTTVATTGVPVAIDGATEASNGADYNTANYKPTTITTKDGKKYELVTVAGTTTDGTTYGDDAVATGEGNDAASGKIVAGATKAVTYIYQEVKGSVVVKYETTGGTQLSGDLKLDGAATATTVDANGVKVENATDVSGGTAYNTTSATYKPTTITTADGKVYKLVAQNNGLKDGSAPENGDTATVIAGETRTVTYLYEEVKGSVVVKYETTDGTQLSGDLKLDDAATATTVDANGVKVENATDVSGGTAYNTTSATYKPTTITTADGKVYKLVAQNNGLKDGSAPESGDDATVAAGETLTVTYVYQEVKGDVTVKYIDDQGNELAGTATMPNGTEESVTTDGIKVANQESLDQDYDTTAKKATRIVTADGKVYELAGDVKNDKVTATNSVKSDSDAETGKVKEDPQNVTYVYKEVKGNVTVHYVDVAGNPISGTTTGIDKKTVGTSEVDESNASIGKAYDTTDLRPTTITVKNEDGTETVYYYKQVQDGSATETGKVTETPTNVTYVYEKAGNVVVKYVTTDGTKLEGELSFDGSTTKTTVPETGLADETNAEPGKEYNTTDHKPATITTADGKTYALVVENNGVKSDSAPETGKVKAGETTTVTYVYQEVKGSVKVEYYDEDGNKITTDKPVVTESSTGIDYDATTSEYRPETITTANGDVYYYKAVKSDSEPTSGKVTEGETVVKYVYEKAGSVTINYISTDGTVIKQPVKDVENVKPGTAYDTTESSDSKEERPTVISTGGKVYRLVQTAGKTTTGVSYDENGVATGEGHYPTTGTVAAGLDKNVTYVYQEVQFGDVEVAYINTNGEKIADTESVESGTEVGTKYTTTPKAIITVTNTDGTTTTYRLVTTEGTTTTGVTYDANGVATGEGHAPATGEVTATKQTVTYVYEAVKGNVVVNYIDENGKPISGTTTGIAKTSVSTSEPDTTGANVGTHYDTADLRPETITTAEGKVYKLLPALTKGNETGQVTEGTTTVTYVYQLQKGDVDVHYVNTDGKEIAPTVKDTDDADTGSDYDTTDHKPEKIVEDSTGDVYYYKEIKSGDKETGKVTAGTTDVTYVYEKAGNVVVNYVTTDGTVIKDPVNDETNAKPGSGYDTTDNKPATITKDGKTYQLVAKNNGLQDGSAPESGKVEAGKTTEITYVYEEVKTPEVKQGNVVVENYDTKGNKLGDTTEVVKPSPEGTEYTTTPADKIESNGKTYYYKEVKSDSEPTSGKVKEGTTTVKYVYEEAGNVVVNYVTTDGTVIKEQVKDETNAKPGSGYDTTDNKPATITKDGKTYQLVAKNNGLQDGSAPESGKVEAGKTVEVTYVYEEVKTPEVQRGNVVVRYENEKGEVIQNPVNDETNVPVGTKYDTRDHKPTTITKDGKTYELVPSLTRGTETGNVEAGTTVITYVYREVVTPTPTEEKVTKFVEEGTNTVLSPEEKGNQPKKDITGYEFVKTITDESGNTIHVYRKVVTPTPTEEKVTKFVEEGTNKELSPEEKGNQPKKDITGYEFVRTETDANGNTVHIYRKVVTPTPQPTPNPQPTPQPEPTPVPQPTPNPQPKPTPTNVTPAHDAPVQPAAVVTPAQTSAPASASEKQLPNTGTENHAGLAALGLAGLLGGLGLVSRKKKED